MAKFRPPDYEKPKIPKAKNGGGGIAKKGMRVAQAAGVAGTPFKATKRGKLAF